MLVASEDGSIKGPLPHSFFPIISTALTNNFLTLSAFFPMVAITFSTLTASSFSFQQSKSVTMATET